MTGDQSRFWQTLQSMKITAPDAVVTFEDKLLRQTGWTRATAADAIEEYRRFLFLAAMAGHPVSPSPMVDEVWHLHLLYTRHYWETLCPKILGFNLHHEPATGTRADRSKLDDWYARTLASYRQFFGEPPSGIWPITPGEVIFGRVDRSRFIVLPLMAWGIFLGVFAVLVILLVLTIISIAFAPRG